MGWNSMLGVVGGQVMQILPFFYYTTLRKWNHIYYKKEAASTEVKYKQGLPSHV